MLSFLPTSDGSCRAKIPQKPFSKYFERQNLQNQTISELNTDDNKSKYSNNPKDIFSTAKKINETLYTKETTSKAATTEFLTKVLNIKKISSDEFIKSINSQTNESPSNDGLTTEFYKHF